MSYATVSDLELYLGIDGADDSALLQMLLESATQWVDEYTGRTFAVSTDSIRYHDVRHIDGATLWLDTDLCSITTVTNGDSVAVASSNYRTLPRNLTPYYGLKLKDDSSVSWDVWTGEIAIAGKWGYSTTPNATIRQATIRLASWLYRQKDNTAEGDRAIMVTGGVLLPAKLPEDIATMLEPYRRLSL